MTVRVNKQPFNIREKLSELERPIGVKGNELMGAETAQDARDLVSAGRRNLIINGDMKIHQRGGTITATGSGSAIYGLDRWKTWCYPSGVSAVFTLQQATSNPPPGFYNYLRWTTTTAYAVSGNSASFFDIQQTVEGNNLKGIDIGKSTAKPLTISFWARSSIAGKYTFAIYYAGSNPSNYLKYYNINSANTWEYKTITLPPQTATASGESAGSVSGMILSWNMGMGTTYGSTSTTEGYIHNKYELGGSVRIIENTNATFDLTGVQLEIGSNATDFEYRTYPEELALCKRYYQKMGDTNTNELTLGGYAVNNTTIYTSVQLPVEMRAIPTLSQVGSLYSVRANQPGSLAGHRGRKGFGLSFSTTGDGYYLLASNANAYFVLDAEI